LKLIHARCDVAPVIVRQVTPHVRRAEAVRVAAADELPRTFQRILERLAAVVDAGQQVSVYVDTSHISRRAAVRRARAGDPRVGNLCVSSVAPSAHARRAA
jgi:hypothetical protein